MTYYYKNGAPYTGDTHEAEDGSVFTEKTHSTTSKRIFRIEELSVKPQPKPKTVAKKAKKNAR